MTASSKESLDWVPCDCFRERKLPGKIVMWLTLYKCLPYCVCRRNGLQHWDDDGETRVHYSVALLFQISNLGLTLQSRERLWMVKEHSHSNGRSRKEDLTASRLMLLFKPAQGVRTEVRMTFSRGLTTVGSWKVCKPCRVGLDAQNTLLGLCGTTVELLL